MHGSILHVTMPPSPLPWAYPSDLQFFSYLAVWTTNTPFCVQNSHNNIDFCTAANPEIFFKNVNAFLEFNAE